MLWGFGTEALKQGEGKSTVPEPILSKSAFLLTPSECAAYSVTIAFDAADLYYGALALIQSHIPSSLWKPASLYCLLLLAQGISGLIVPVLMLLECRIIYFRTLIAKGWSDSMICLYSLYSCYLSCWFDSKRKENSIFFLRAERDRHSLVSSCLRATPICPIQTKPIAQDHPSIPTVLTLL